MEGTKEQERKGRRDWDHQTMITVEVMTIHCPCLMCLMTCKYKMWLYVGSCSSMFETSRLPFSISMNSGKLWGARKGGIALGT